MQSSTKSSVKIKAAVYNVEVEVKRREDFLNDTREGGNFYGAAIAF